MEQWRLRLKNEQRELELLYQSDSCPAEAEEVQVSIQLQGVHAPRQVEGSVGPDGVRVRISYDDLEALKLWNEFSPSLYQASLLIQFWKGERFLGEQHLDRQLGICRVHTIGTQFGVNGQVTFLRAAEWTSAHETDLQAQVEAFKNRGLNCISISEELLTEKLLEQTDAWGLYVKVHGAVPGDYARAEQRESMEQEVKSRYQRMIGRFSLHPSLALFSMCDDSGMPFVTCTMGVQAGTELAGSWTEFAVRDRQDYSDAPDTKSNHLEDIRKQDAPTLVTSVGEWRNPVKNPAEGLDYLAQICTREAVEAALRTAKFGGFCLHEDAAVLRLPEKRMREFAGAVVPLLMMKKYVWSTDETFSANMVIANYGQDKLFERISVSAYDERGQRYGVTSNKIRLNRGNVASVGQLRIPLEQFAPGQRLELTISIDNTPYRNHYAIWLFADDISVKVPEHVHVTRRLDERTKNLLAAGKKVVYIPKLNRIKGDAGWFSPLASEAASNREVVAAGGILCDPKHPALKGFPTEEMADFQWWNLLHNSIPAVLPDNLHRGFIVSMPGRTPDRADRGLIFETCVGPGRLLVCTTDLLIQLDRPEARQLYASLLAYVSSPRFAPVCSMSVEVLEQLL
jgi:hypothetical protein